jgi:hypothetical protein
VNQRQANKIAQKLEPGDWKTFRKGRKTFTVWANGHFAQVCPIHTRTALENGRCGLCDTWEQRETAAEVAADNAKQRSRVI